jgi:hypothetical protein
MRKAICLSVVSLFAVSAALADEGKAGCPAAKAVAEQSASGCHKGASMASSGCSKAGSYACSMPKIMYVVGEEKSCCEKTATEMASKANTTMKYAVGDKTFDSKADATVALADALETHLNKILMVQYAVGGEKMGCPVSAEAVAKKNGEKVQYQLATYTFEDKAKAEKIATAAREAADKVTMAATVDGKKFGCCSSAESVAKADGKQIEYVVGESKTACKTDARVTLAQAKIEAALKAMSEAAGA